MTTKSQGDMLNISPANALVSWCPRDKVKPDRIILPSADSPTKPLLVDLGFTAAEAHPSIDDGLGATHSKLLFSLSCLGLWPASSGQPWCRSGDEVPN